MAVRVLFLVFSLCAYSASNVFAERHVEDGLLVKVEQGLLRGELLQSAAGGSFYSFKGIPYAQSPVGQLRFKDAEPPLPWEGVRNASEHGNVCPRPFSAGDEDCLFLNVYTPQLPKNNSSKLPVMFWIHGGGFAGGSGDSDAFGPDYLVAENVVVVTINYRLGALGFLHLEDAAPSNIGLKDQVSALRWVQRNIAAFGGDPGRVTIFGESAGSMSVSLLMLSPATEGLFHGAIAQSGHGMFKCGNSTALREMSLKLAEAVNCSAETSPAVLECLRDIAAPVLVNVSFQIMEKDRVLECSFVPVVDTEVPGFLPESSTTLIQNGRIHPVPFIIGFNEKEANGILNVFNFYDEKVAEKFDSTWDSKIVPTLRGTVDVSSGKEISQKLRDFYMKGKSITNETIPGLIDMMTDIAFGEGSYFTLKYTAKYTKAPLFQYIFSVDDELNIIKYTLPPGLNMTDGWAPFCVENVIYLQCLDAYPTGACHTDELTYLFRIRELPDVPSNSSAALARERMVRLWTNFAKYGVPTLHSDPLLGVTWKSYTTDERNFLEIGSTLRPGKDLYSSRVELWEELYDKYLSGQPVEVN